MRTNLSSLIPSLLVLLHLSQPGRSISIRESNGTVRTVALPSTLVVPPDLSYGKYATVTLQRVKRGLPRFLSVSMGEALRPPLDPAPEPSGRSRGPAAREPERPW